MIFFFLTKSDSVPQTTKIGAKITFYAFGKNQKAQNQIQFDLKSMFWQ